MNYLDTITALQATRSRNEKIKILKQTGVLTQAILEYTYNPFKHYFINKIPKYKNEGGSTLALVSWLSLLSKLQTREVSGGEAKLLVSDMLENLCVRDAKILESILKKDLRCGISAKTINAAIPGLVPEFGAMLAKKWEDDRLVKGLYMSIKYDGLRAIFKDGNLYTRNGHVIQGVQHITNCIPKDYSFDGELLIPGLHFQESSGKIRSDDPTLDAVYKVFDVPKGTMTFDRRYQLYSDVVGILDAPSITSVKHVQVRSLEHAYDTFDKALAAGYEGLVFKTPKHLYQTKRSWDWMKLKAENSKDLHVVDFFEGTGKYEGQLGGLIVSHKGVKVRVGSGFSDIEREQMWDNQDVWLGRTVEVKYHEVTPDGSLRHPVYKGQRWDKD